MSEPVLLPEWRRRAYLEAMGVAIWEPRGLSATPAPAAAGAESEADGHVAEVRAASAALSLEVVGVSALPSSAEERSDWPAAQEADVGWDLLEDSDPAYFEAASAPPQFPSGESGWDLAPAGEAEPAAVEPLDWDGLRSAVAQCRACGLCETRTQTVFGVGNERADLMIVGEAPGADEDREGEPFVGRAGQLLNRMLAAIGCPREQVYIANVLKCRPPGNRDPKPDEALRCEGFLRRQMELVRPKLILTVGRVSAQHLLRTETSVGRLRGRWLEYSEPAVPLRVTYHPAYLLRSPEQKAKAWDDLTEVRRRLDQLGSKL